MAIQYIIIAHFNKNLSNKFHIIPENVADKKNGRMLTYRMYDVQTNIKSVLVKCVEHTQRESTKVGEIKKCKNIS